MDIAEVFSVAMFVHKVQANTYIGEPVRPFVTLAEDLERHAISRAGVFPPRTPSRFPLLDTTLCCRRLCHSFSREITKIPFTQRVPMYRFTIRDLLWLMVVIAMDAAWWADRESVNVARRDGEFRLRLIADFLHNTQATGVV